MTDNRGDGRLENTDFSFFFEPSSIAVIGSLRQGFFGGYVAVKSLLNAGYDGKIFPINPTIREVHGLKVYPSLQMVDGQIDLALLIINARSVPDILKDCAAKGIKGVIVVSDGFAERDREGARLQKEMVKIARGLGIRIIGPNTAGVANASNGFNPCPFEDGSYKLREGSIAICSQTGMSNPHAFPFPDLGAGVSKICDFGNKCDLDECDILEYLEKDTKTRVISMYLESIRDGSRFLEIAKRVSSKKPLLILKLGRTAEGARASASHTGAMSLDDKIFDAACTQAGILRHNTYRDIFEIPKIFTMQPLPKGNRLGIITYSGGIGVLAIDQGDIYGLTVTRLMSQTEDGLNRMAPGLGKMPVDIGPVAPKVKDYLSLYPKILETVMADENVDALFNVLWADTRGNTLKAYIEAYEGVKDRYGKPLVSWIYGTDKQAVNDHVGQFEDLGFPVFRDPETCIKAIGMASRYALIHNRCS